MKIIPSELAAKELEIESIDYAERWKSLDIQKRYAIARTLDKVLLNQELH